MKFIRFFLCAAILLACLSLTAYAAAKIDLEPYISVIYTGSNGSGTARTDFDFASFEYDIMSQWKGEEQLEKLGDLTAVEMTIIPEPTLTENLSNGDTFTVKIYVDEELAKSKGYAFSGMEKTFTVEGLTDAILIDPFAENVFGPGKPVDASLSGIDPFVIFTLYNTAELSDPIRHIDYRSDNDWNLKNGDVIIITATLDKKFEQQGYRLSRTETTIPVEGFDRYVSCESDLPEDVLRRISDRAYQECANGGNCNIFDGVNNLTPWSARFENIYVGDTALLTVNNNIETEYSFLLVPVYKTIICDEWYDMETGTTYPKTWEDVFAYYKFSDVIVHPDGTVSYNESYVDVNGSYTDMAAAEANYLSYWQQNYTFKEIPMPEMKPEVQ